MNDTPRAIALMIFAMASLAIGDMLIKMATQSLPVAQVILTVSMLGALGFCVIVAAKGLPLFPPRFWDRRVLARNCAEGCAGFFMISALAAAPLITVTAITQAVPILATLGAVVILGEIVGTRRWVAIFAGLLGVLVILRPTPLGLDTGLLLSVGAAFFLALRDVLTRAIPQHVHVLQLAFWGMTFNIFGGLALAALNPAFSFPDPRETALLFGSVITIMAGYFSVTHSVRLAEVSLVVPIRYIRLPIGIILGVVFLSETLDLWTLIGAGIIVAAGLYILRRERSIT